MRGSRDSKCVVRDAVGIGRGISSNSVWVQGSHDGDSSISMISRRPGHVLVRSGVSFVCSLLLIAFVAAPFSVALVVR